MTKFTVESSQRPDATAPPTTGVPAPRSHRDITSCDLYAPGHQIHYQHQGAAVRTPSLLTSDALLDGSMVTLLLADGSELRWRHHDPGRLRRIVDLLRGKCVVYPEAHAIRVGPYWFNCATEADQWQPCRVATPDGG
ncbi:MAG TPA: hypothetical protein VER39_12260 [Nocardioidaceae bacterium]|nr:hypothetical protein [Nocardioidaceae bacterium]